MEIADVKSLWENIFSGNTPEEVTERVKNNIAEMEAGNCAALVSVVDNHVIGMEQCGRIPEAVSCLWKI